MLLCAAPGADHRRGWAWLRRQSRGTGSRKVAGLIPGSSHHPGVEVSPSETLTLTAPRRARSHPARGTRCAPAVGV